VFVVRQMDKSDDGESSVDKRRGDGEVEAGWRVDVVKRRKGEEKLEVRGFMKRWEEASNDGSRRKFLRSGLVCLGAEW
jgi:hypothetical protein